jgi:hypothetical protein
MSQEKTKFQLRIEEDLRQRAEKAAQKKGISVSGLFRLYLIEGLERDEQKWPPRRRTKNKPSEKQFFLLLPHHPGTLLRLAHWISESKYGKVFTPLKAVYSRLPLPFSPWANRIHSREQKPQISEAPALLVRALAPVVSTEPVYFWRRVSRFAGLFCLIPKEAFSKPLAGLQPPNHHGKAAHPNLRPYVPATARYP